MMAARQPRLLLLPLRVSMRKRERASKPKELDSKTLPERAYDDNALTLRASMPRACVMVTVCSDQWIHRALSRATSLSP